MRKIAVVGGGMAGLACATELSQKGFQVELFESEERLGGRMRTRVQDGLAFDIGANFFVGAYRQVLELARRHGLTLVRPGPTEHAVYRNGKPLPLHLDPSRNLFRADFLNLWSRLRLLLYVRKLRQSGSKLDFFDLSSLPPEWELGDAYSASRTHCGRRVTDYLVEGFHDTMMFYSARESSAGLLRSLLGQMSDPRFDFGVVHPYGHMQSLADTLGSRLHTHLGCPVTALVPLESSQWKVEWPGYSKIFDAVVLAATAGSARKLIPDQFTEHRRVVDGTRYSLTINLAFSLPLGSLGSTHCFYVPPQESDLICEFTNEVSKGTHASIRGRSLVTVGLHEQAARELYNRPDESIFLRVKHELLRLLPDLWSHQLLPHDLQRWPEAIPKYDGGQIGRVREFQQQHQGRHGLYLCGDYLNAPWLEGACRSGQSVAAQIVRSHQEVYA
jgi:oxygen-dependent protoporphyrinogen oxidase